VGFIGRYVRMSSVVMAVFAIGVPGAAEASAQVLAPTPTHLVAGPRIAIPAELRLSNSSGSQTLVTPSQARGISVSMWRLWEDALISSDTTALTQLSPPGALLTGELYNCAWPSGGCVAETSARPINSLTVIVPVQHSYPIYFLAEVSTTQDVASLNTPAQWVPWVELQILTKANASAPWQLSFDTGYDGVNRQLPPLPPFELQPLPGSSSSSQADWYNPPPTRASSTTALSFLPLLAQYYQSFKDTGHPPTSDRFIVDGGADAYGTQFATGRQNVISLGSRNRYAFSADPSAGEWEFSGAGGLPIECGTVVDTSTNTPVGGPVLLQNADRTNWGMPLSPGIYSKIVTTTTHMTCVNDTDGLLDAEGNSGFMTSVTGPNDSALAVGLAIAAAALLVVLGVIVMVAVLVTRRRRAWGPPGALINPPNSWPGGPSGQQLGTAPPPPPWQAPWSPPAGGRSPAWSPQGPSTQAHPGFPPPRTGWPEQSDDAVPSDLVGSGEPSGPRDSS
jgi:hypothetical protein